MIKIGDEVINYLHDEKGTVLEIATDKYGKSIYKVDYGKFLFWRRTGWIDDLWLYKVEK